MFITTDKMLILSVGAGSHLFVFGRLGTFPRIAADGTQGSSGTIIASRISVEQGSATSEDGQFEDIDLPNDEELEHTDGKK